MSGRMSDQDLRIPPDEFERIRSSSKMHARNLDVAYELLVEEKGL